MTTQAESVKMLITRQEIRLLELIRDTHYGKVAIVKEGDRVVNVVIEKSIKL